MEHTAKIISLVAAFVSFGAADILFMRSDYCWSRPLLGYWVLHLPIHCLHGLLLKKLLHLQLGAKRVEWRDPVCKAFVEICANSGVLLLSRAFHEPLSEDVPISAVDVYLLASVAVLVAYVMLVSCHLPSLELGISFTACLTGMCIPMLYHITGITVHLRGAAFALLLCSISTKSYVHLAINPTKNGDRASA